VLPAFLDRTPKFRTLAAVDLDGRQGGGDLHAPANESAGHGDAAFQLASESQLRLKVQACGAYVLAACYSDFGTVSGLEIDIGNEAPGKPERPIILLYRIELR